MWYTDNILYSSRVGTWVWQYNGKEKCNRKRISEKKEPILCSDTLGQDVSPKKNANCYQEEQNVTVSNALDNEKSHKTCPNEEKQKKNEPQTF